MQLPSRFSLDHPPAVAAFVLLNKHRLEDALHELAAHYTPQLGETRAYTDVAAAFTDVATRPDWLTPERAADVLRTTADMRELIDTPR